MGCPVAGTSAVWSPQFSVFCRQSFPHLQRRMKKRLYIIGGSDCRSHTSLKGDALSPWVFSRHFVFWRHRSSARYTHVIIGPRWTGISLCKLRRTTAHSLLTVTLPVVLIGWRNCQCFNWSTFNFLSIWSLNRWLHRLKKNKKQICFLSETASTQIMSHNLRHN